MTFKEWEEKINEEAKIMERLPRFIAVPYECLKRGITDKDKIRDYIIRSYTTPTKEFSGCKIKTLVYGTKRAKRALKWLTKNKLLK